MFEHAPAVRPVARREHVRDHQAAAAHVDAATRAPAVLREVHDNGPAGRRGICHAARIAGRCDRRGHRPGQFLMTIAKTVETSFFRIIVPVGFVL